MSKSRLFLDSDNYKKFCKEVAPSKQPRIDLGASVGPGKKEKIALPLKQPEFDKLISNFFGSISLKKIPTITQINDLLNNPFIIGEIHHDIAPKKFLIENMVTLKEAGFNTFFLEHIFYDYQALLDNYFETGVMDIKLKNHLTQLDRNKEAVGIEEWYKTNWSQFNFTQLVTAARSAGIRIVGIDIEAVYKSQKPGPSHFDNKDRTKNVNYTACQIIAREQELHPGKWFALMGNSHVSHFDDVNGVADLMGAARVFIFDEEPDQLVQPLVTEIANNIKVDSGVTGIEFTGDICIRCAQGSELPTLQYSHPEKKI